MNLPKKLTLPHSQTKHAELYKAVNAIIDYLAEREPKKRSIWNLKEGDKYFYIDILGDIDEEIFSDDSVDAQLRKNGNIFLTYEEAEAERDRRREMAKGSLMGSTLFTGLMATAPYTHD